MKQAEHLNNAISDSVELLRSLDFSKLENHQRGDLVVPGSDGRFRPISELFYNDIGSRARQFQAPADRVQVHRTVLTSLCQKLGIASLGSLHLQPLGLDLEDMGEDLTTRIRNVLRAYSIEQAFNEFLANAADAGASEFSIMLDNDMSRRQACADDVLCENLAQYCTGPALVLYNNAEFTTDDIRGICRIGRGGKEGRDETIGRFGLGSLSFYHFSEVRPLYLRRNDLLKPVSARDDPHGIISPSPRSVGTESPHRLGEERLCSNASKRSEVRKAFLMNHAVGLIGFRFYPGHLHVFDGLCGFDSANTDHYQGVRPTFLSTL